MADARRILTRAVFLSDDAGCCDSPRIINLICLKKNSSMRSLAQGEDVACPLQKSQLGACTINLRLETLVYLVMSSGTHTRTTHPLRDSWITNELG